VKRVCVFCGASPLTREHVFPRWLTAVLPEQERWRGQTTVTAIGEQVNDLDLPLASRTMGERFTEATVVRVCAPCNHGWMNDLEREVRSDLTLLVEGATGLVPAKRSSSLATWVAKTCLMAEFTHPESATSTPEDYRWLHKYRLPPPGMNIWAFPTETADWGVRMQHLGWLYGEPNQVDTSEPCNTRSTTLGLGRVAFCVTATTSAGLSLPSFDDIPPLGAVRLWPATEAIVWDRQSPLGDEDVWFVSDFLRLWLGEDDDWFLEALAAVAARRGN
jgi:hypothetical protein